MSDPHKPRSGCLTILLALVVVVVIAVVGVILWRTSSYRQLEASIRAKGEPVTFAELDAYYPDVPDADNAALLVLAANDVRNAPPPGAPVPYEAKRDVVDPSAPLTDETRRAVADYLGANQESFTLLAQAAALAESRYPFSVSSFVTGKPAHLAGVRAMARLEAIDALYRIDIGDPAAAAASTIGIYRIADTLRNEPALVSQLVRVACYSMGFETVETLLCRTSVSERDLKALQDQLRAAEFPEAFHRALAGERCFLMDSTPMAGGATMGVPRFFGGQIVRGMTELVDASQLPEAERRRAFEEIQQQLDSPRASNVQFFLDPLRAILLPPLATAIDAFDRNVAELRVAATAIAIERYRLANGNVPGTLDALVPDYLESVPTDPFDGKPLRYLHGDFGYTVYSIGQDCTDNGGAELKNRAQSGSDIALSVTR